MSPNTFLKLATENGWATHEESEPVPDGWDDIARIVLIGAGKALPEADDAALMIGASFATRGPPHGGRWIQLGPNYKPRTHVIDDSTGRSWHWDSGAWRWLLLNEPEDIAEMCPGYPDRATRGVNRAARDVPDRF